MKKKLNEWPHIVFKSGLSTEIAKEFEELRLLRNELTHFKSTYQVFEIDAHTRIEGLSDTTAFESLNGNRARAALMTAERVLAEIFHLKGVSNQELQHAMHSWAGKLGA